MEFSFSDALDKLGTNAAFRFVNEVRPPSEYLFETLLPEEKKNSYYIDNAYMLIRPTMAGLVGMDSPYAPGGVVEASRFLEESAKLGMDLKLGERQLRQIQEIIQNRNLTGDARTTFLQGEATSFLENVVAQGLMDTDEWLRGRALIDGTIDWTFNKLNLNVDYGVPASHKLANRTGNDAYVANHANNKFWADHYEALKLLRYNLRAIIIHTDLMLKMINNDALKLEVLSQNDNVIRVRRWRSRGNVEQVSGDARDVVTFIMYDLEGDALDPADTSKTIHVPFMDTDKILYVGKNRRNGYRVGEGAVPDPVRAMALGYSHLAPTVESGGSPGRWASQFVLKEKPWELRSMGAENTLPVREDVTATEAKTVTLSTDLS